MYICILVLYKLTVLSIWCCNNFYQISGYVIYVESLRYFPMSSDLWTFSCIHPSTTIMYKKNEVVQNLYIKECYSWKVYKNDICIRFKFDYNQINILRQYSFPLIKGFLSSILDTKNIKFLIKSSQSFQLPEDAIFLFLEMSFFLLWWAIMYLWFSIRIFNCIIPHQNFI